MFAEKNTSDRLGSARLGAAAVWHLIRRTSCSQALFIPLTTKYKVANADVSTAIRMLAGGVGHSGELVCGTITGGMLAMSAIIWKGLPDPAARRQELALNLCGRYFQRMEAQRGSLHCFDQVGTDFFDMRDLARYFFRFRWARCARISYRAARIADGLLTGIIPKPLEPDKPLSMPDPDTESASCALKVYLNTLPNAYDADWLRAASLGFDGGLGLCGRTCAALLAASLSVGYYQALSGSHSGYGLIGNVLDEVKVERIHTRSANLVRKFHAETSTFNCAEITGKQFADVDELTTHLKAGGCREIIELAGRSALAEIESFT